MHLLWELSTEQVLDQQFCSLLVIAGPDANIIFLSFFDEHFKWHFLKTRSGKDGLVPFLPDSLVDA